MRNKATLILLAILLSVMQIPHTMYAYTGGLLNGKNATVMDYSGTIVGTTALITDNDEATHYTVTPWVNSPSTRHVVLWDLEHPVTVTSYKLKTNATTQLRYLAFFFYDGTHQTYTNPSSDGTAVAVSLPKPVKRIQFWNEDTTTGINVQEFDIFGTEIGNPAPPTGFTATAGVNQVSLSWNVHSDLNVTGYNVYMGGVKQNTTPLTTTSYTKTGLTNGTVYTFGVTAIDRYGQESSPAAQTATPLAPPDTTAPNAPTALTGTGGNAVANLSWNAPTIEDDFAGYHVYRDGVQLTGALITATSYQATGLENDRAYEFYVKAFDTSGNGSPASNTVTVTPSDNMTVTLIPNGTSIVVRIAGGSMPYEVTIDGGTVQTFTQREFAVTGLAKDTDYVVVIEDSAGKTYSQTVNTGSTTSFIPPVMPDSTSLFQKMLNSFGTAGTIAIAVIGGAVALGVLIILGLWGWRLLKKWLASSK